MEIMMNFLRLTVIKTILVLLFAIISQFLLFDYLAQY